jgi:hypothetical protein
MNLWDDRETRYNIRRRNTIVLFDVLYWEAANYVHNTTPHSFATALADYGYSLEHCK